MADEQNPRKNQGGDPAPGANAPVEDLEAGHVSDVGVVSTVTAAAAAPGVFDSTSNIDRSVLDVAVSSDEPVSSSGDDDPSPRSAGAGAAGALRSRQTARQTYDEEGAPLLATAENLVLLSRTTSSHREDSSTAARKRSSRTPAEEKKKHRKKLDEKISQKARTSLASSDAFSLEKVIDDKAHESLLKEKFDISDLPPSWGLVIPLLIVFTALFILQTFAFSVLAENGLPYKGVASEKKGAEYTEKYPDGTGNSSMWGFTHELPVYLAMSMMIWLPCKKTVWDLTGRQILKAAVIGLADLIAQVLSKNALALVGQTM